MANVCPTLLRGSLSKAALGWLYGRIGGAMRWYATHDPYDTAGLAIMSTLLWQLGNLRHRTVALIDVVDRNEFNLVPGTINFSERPKLDDFVLPLDVPGIDTWRAPKRIEVHDIPAPGNSDEMRFIKRLLLPVCNNMQSPAELPTDVACVLLVQACLVTPCEGKYDRMWAYALAMWECGALWASTLGRDELRSSKARFGRLDLDKQRIWVSYQVE
ncbi:unnamed protein product [Clonostachys rosea]|uniref:Fungal-type protein kinase domain-containing protein n=1 Tax=Bionectria ochroleuca TaxID=29856 RepID=A0ABY6U9C9_BIOOC|nr:unnamed protein product [Clonostachys rosea]